ncbi:MAG: YitT family protein [Bacteroidales bacterium]|nr:YitT family protein [Bacteroidales bacterium]
MNQVIEDIKKLGQRETWTMVGQALISFKFWKELVIMTIGMLLVAACVNYFLTPASMIIGTISGLSIVLSKLLGGAISVPTMIVIINAILLVLAWFLIGKEFGAKTVYTAMILGPLVDLEEKILPWESLAIPVPGMDGTVSVMGNLWFDLLCFILMLSASQAILFSINASTGGLDILAKIVNKYLHFDIGKSVTIAGGIICCTAFLINDARMVIIGLIGTWLNGVVVDYFTALLNNRKRVCIVSKDTDKLRQFIINDIHRGCTLHEVIGGFTGEKSLELETLLTKDDFAKLHKYIDDNKISAFMTVDNVSEMFGFWNKNKHARRHAESR